MSKASTPATGVDDTTISEVPGLDGGGPSGPSSPGTNQASARRGRVAEWVVKNVGLLAVLFLVLPPIAMLLYGSFQSAPPGAGGDFTLEKYLGIFTEPRYIGAIKNTLIIAAFVSLSSTVLGTALAWVVFRTDVPGKRFFTVMITVSFFFPSFISALAWAILASPRAGILATLFPGAGINIYSVTGIVWVLMLSYLPYSFLFCSGPFQAMDPSLEDAARMSGASNMRVAFTVTLPLARYSILSAGALIFVHSMGVFGVPAILGQPAGIYVLATRLWRLTKDHPTDLAMAAALGTLMIAFTAVFILIQRRFLKGREYTSVTGKGYQPMLARLGRFRYPALIACLGYVALAVVLPIAVITFRSLVPFFAPGQGEALRMGLDNYRGLLFTYPITGRAFRNSLLLSGLGGLSAVFLCVIVAYIIVRTRWRLRRLLDVVSTLPIGVPGLVIGAGLLWVYLRFPLGLYGTMWILLLSYTARYLPYGVNNISGSLVQIDAELEEAAQISGASWLRTMRTIVLPLIGPALISTYMLLFVDFFKELSSAILLYTTGNEVVSVAIWDLYENAEWGMASALSMLALVAVYGLLAIILIWRPQAIRGVGD